jgi:hypothetical protein
MTKHRAGRPRKAGPRQPCGHLRPSGAEPPSPAQIKRIQTGLLKSSTEQLLGDEVGRLYFHKLLTERQVSAAFRVADVYGREDRRMGRRRSCRSPSYLTGRSGDGDLADERMTPEEREEAERRDQATAAAFRDLQDHIPARPPGLLALVEALCVDGLHIGTVRAR